MTLTKPDFDFIRELVRRRAAIVLEPGKEYLVVTRLDPILRSQGMGSLAELVSTLRSEAASPLHEQVVEAMTTNETSFFRDQHPFDSLRTDVLPEVIERNPDSRMLNIWCAACSTGQEPYSVAMLLREHFPELASWSILIMATDVSPTVLAQARHGRFGQLEVNRGLPARLLLKYFQREGLFWHIDESLRKMVRFQRHNLVGPWPTFPLMDIVFLRNVLIYFGADTKQAVLNRVGEAIRPGGYLLLGSAETTTNMGSSFERHPIGRTLWYRKAGAVVSNDGQRDRRKP